MKLYKLFFIPLFALCIGCNDSKKQTLASEGESEGKPEMSVDYSTELVMDAITPNPGIKYKEVRKNDSSAPPVILNLEQKSEEKEIKLSEYYTSVKYVKLKHPYSNQGKAFLGNSNGRITYEQGSTSWRGLNSSVYLTPEYIIAGDAYFGYHCFDKEGNFIYTISVTNMLPEFDQRSNTLSFERDNSRKTIYSVFVLGDNCVIHSSQDGNTRLDFHNIPSKKTYLSRPSCGGRVMLINPETFVSLYYHLEAPVAYPFLHSFEMKGDTLCRFISHNPVIENPNRKAFTNPDHGVSYYYNNTLTIRQAYNDTVYRMSAPNELTPAYILNFGKKKADLWTALYGDKSNILLPYHWLETEHFAFIIHSQNYDCPNNRNNNTIKFFYSYFDKKNNRLHSIPSTSYPEDFFLPNDMENGIPLLADNAYSDGKSLYIGHTKLQLENILKHKTFSSLPSEQQDKVRSLHEDMEDGDLLVMILE